MKKQSQGWLINILSIRGRNNYRDDWRKSRGNIKRLNSENQENGGKRNNRKRRRKNKEITSTTKRTEL